MNDQNLQQLMRYHASAKKKLVLGIVFTCLAYFFCLLGLATLYFYVGVVFLVLSLPFFCIGIPFLIIGIVKVPKSNRKIALAKMKMKNTPPQEQPAVTTCDNASQDNEIIEQSAPVAQQPVTEPDVQPATEETEKAENSGRAELNWQKYNPLDAGITYNKDKDYHFHSADGFMGSVPQKFVNRTFPKCPLCCSKNPMWTISQHNQMSWKGNLYLFKCSQCESIISMSMPDVTTLANGPSGVVSNPNVGLANLVAKKSSGKEAGAIYAVIESVGSSGVSNDCEGKEFKLEDMQDMYLR